MVEGSGEKAGGNTTHPTSEGGDREGVVGEGVEDGRVGRGG